TTVTVGNTTVDEDATSATVEVKLDGHIFKTGETVTVRVGDKDVEFTSNGTQNVTFTVTPDSDSIIEADSTKDITATVSSSAGIIENPVVNNGILTVTDSINTTTVTLEATDSTSEDGGKITYTAKLPDGVIANSDITVKLSVGANGEPANSSNPALTITIKAGESSGKAEATVSRDDVYKETDSLTASITEVSEANAGEVGSLENLTYDDTAVVTEITDDIDIVYVDVTANNIDIHQGSSVTYTVTLRNKDGLEVKNHDGLTITLSNGTKITIPAGEISSSSSPVKVDKTGSHNIKVEKIVETATANSGKQFEDIQSGKTVTVNVSSSKFQNDTAIAIESGSGHIDSQKDKGQTATGNVLKNDDIFWPTDRKISKVTFDGKEITVKSSGHTEIIGKYGTLTINSKGDFEYKINDDNPEVDALNIGDKLADHFTYETPKGEAVLTIEIQGRNDAPIIENIETNGVTLTGIYNDYQSDNISENITAQDLLKNDGKDSYQFKNENNTLKMDIGKTETDVSIKYEGKNAGYKSILGYYEKNSDGTIGNLKIIFVNGSMESDVSLKAITGEIGFFLIPNGANNKDIMKILNQGEGKYSLSRDDSGQIIFTSGKNTVTAKDVYYTDESLSTEKQDHTIALKSDNPNSIIIGFEDTPLNNNKTDYDYNDFVISVTFTPSESLTNKLFKNIEFSDVDDDSLSEATVVLKNAKDGDKINIAGDLKEGIGYTIIEKDGQIIIKFTGKASHEAYAEALEAIRFSTKNSEDQRELNFDIEIKDPNGKIDKTSTVIIGKGFNNHIPTIDNEEVSAYEDVPYTFSKKDFDSYKDIDGDDIETIKIITLPDSTKGVLKYDGELISAGKEILVKDLDKLVYETVKNSDEDVTFKFQVSDDRGAYSEIKEMYINIIGVADAPDLAIDITKVTSEDYAIKVNVQLTDGSEVLKKDSAGNTIITLKNIPDGSKLFDSDGKEINAKNDGSYTVKVDENGEANLSLKGKEFSDTELNGIQAEATSYEKNKDGVLTDSATTTATKDTISFDSKGDIDLSNLKGIIKDLKEINLTNDKENKLSLTLDDVLKLSGDDNTIKISGDKFDKVEFKNEDGKVWEKQQSITDGDKTFDVYSGSIGDQTVQVKVEQPISDGITN
ncbi:immunoglobulin-like domain-containing protein, partial [Arcobacter sp. CECT 9188]|uniref:immunoglobulin-like domain-containing protein n=2 Tax=Arcobacteraceae TaxID=2808963 RepID=UPI000DEA1B05